MSADRLRLDRAAEALWKSIDDKGIRGRLFREDCDYLARALADAGVLATPEHDRKVIEKFLRERDTPSMRIENPEFIAPLLAKAWDEGHTAGVRNASAEFDGPVQDNPYKREGGATDAVVAAACDREHDDEWVKVDDWSGLPDGARIRSEWMVGVADGVRRFILRDDLPDTTQKENR